MLSNIYLHEVLDSWFEQEAKARLPGQAKLIRFADDSVPRMQTQKGVATLYNR